MKIITAANHRYKDIVETLIVSCNKVAVEWVCYDLGGLGFGKPFTVLSEKFQNEGEYEAIQKQQFGIRKSRALFKPSVVKDAMSDYPNEQLIWLDSDCVVHKPITLEASQFDIGVAKRSEKEVAKTKMMIASGMGGLAKYQGFHNAGFIVFNPTENARAFVDHWEALTEKVGNDQLALNVLLESDEATIKVFPHCYNAQIVDDTTVIQHKKGKKP